MLTRNMTVKFSNGLEARPVAVLVQVASQFKSKIYIESENKKINAKSIMGMMGLGLAGGEEITVTAEGEDAEEALDGIEKYLSSDQ